MSEDRKALMDRKNKILSLNTQEQRDYECAKWGVEYLRDYEKKPLPEKPAKVINFYSLPKQEIEKMNRRPEDFKDFWQDTDVYKYFNDLNEIKNSNASNLEWLQWMKKILKGTPEESKIDRALATHEGGERITWDD